MAFFDIFKKRKKDSFDDRLRKKTRERAQTEKEVPLAKEEKIEHAQEKQMREQFASNLASFVLEAPRITEKATGEAARDIYSFRIHSHATKPQVKKAVEELYHVDVRSVRIVNAKSKIRRIRGVQGRKKGFKKAYVALQKGHKIEFV